MINDPKENTSGAMVDCPICGKPVDERDINAHIDSGCEEFTKDQAEVAVTTETSTKSSNAVSSFFQTPAQRKASTTTNSKVGRASGAAKPTTAARRPPPQSVNHAQGAKRSLEHDDTTMIVSKQAAPKESEDTDGELHAAKRKKLNAMAGTAPLADRMRPRTLDEVCGQDLVGPNGVLRGLIEKDRLPSIVLWGGPGTGKTTIARLIARQAGSRFVEINSTSTGVGECKKLFADARSELLLTGKKTIVFCDEIHRFSKSQQDVFLGPVESGQITLVGATTENPSFKVVNALLSRCRTFTLAKLTDDDIVTILQRALDAETLEAGPFPLIDLPFMRYLAAFADGDARTGLNLLELAMELSKRPDMTQEEMKKCLTKTLVYDRAGDQHYDTISAFHKSIRGSDPDAALYYLARMLQSGEDPLYIARRLIVVASEDVGLADNSMLSLATAAYTAAEKLGMPECRINLAHATVAMALSKKSTRAYRALNHAYSALSEPGIAGIPVPVHLRNAPTRLLKELGYGKEYKYNPDYANGLVVQEYLPEELWGRRFLEESDFGSRTDLDFAHQATIGETNE